MIDVKFCYDPGSDVVRSAVTEHLDKISRFTGCDIFLLQPKQADPDNASAVYVSGSDQTLEQRLRIIIYGDYESSEHAKMRCLVMIDQIVRIWTKDLFEKRLISCR